MIFYDRSIPIHRKVVKGGIVSALILVSLLLSSWLPTNKLFFLALSSLFVSVIIVDIDILYALLVYLVTSFLAFVLVPNRGIFLGYSLFFGTYGIIKLFIENIKTRVLQWILKLLYFNGSLSLLIWAAKLFIQENITPPWLWLLIIAQIVFIIYDIIYSMFTSYYQKKLKKILNLR